MRKFVLWAIVAICCLQIACKKESSLPSVTGIDMSSDGYHKATILWANCNLGANSPELPGDYYAWSEGEDAVAKVLGKGWRMPTSAEFAELVSNCTVEFVPYEEDRWIVGCRLKSKSTGETLYFPAWGYKDEDGKIVHKNSYGYYWTSTPLDTDNAKSYYISDDGCKSSSESISLGLQIRPVKDL